MNAFKRLFTARTTLIWFIVTAVLLAIIIVANILATTMLATLFDTIFGRPKPILGDTKETLLYARDYDTKENARAAGALLSEEIIEEGAVLLKNDGNALPFYTPESPNENKTASKPMVSVFGRNSVSLSYGGSGSGGAKNLNPKTLYESLTAAGFELNPALEDFYKGKPERSANPGIESGGEETLNTGETPWNDYDQTLKNSFANYQEAAFVVFTRIGGEGFDLPRAGGHGARAHAVGDHFLRLDKNERALIDGIAGEGFTKIIVLINSNNPMELGVIKDDDRVSGCIWFGTPGETGIMGLGRIINGTVSPSGKTVDTYARDFTTNPVWTNFGDMNEPGHSSPPVVAAGHRYLNSANVSNPAEIRYTFVDYEEGIYIGYRYYETRGYIEHNSGNIGWYDNNVVYPFGYGLSYTTFTQEISGAKPTSITKDNKIKFNVKVTNTGTTAAKDVIQIYVTAPYLSGLEKSYVVLVEFAKTGVIAPNKDEIVPIEIDPYYFASYDAADSECFILNAGQYEIKLGKSARFDAVWDSFTADVASKIMWKGGARAEVKNRYDDADDQLSELLSREAFESTMPKARTLSQRVLTNEIKAKLDSKATNNPNTITQFPDTNKPSPNGIAFIDMIDKSYSDSEWKEFIEMLTVQEMTNLVTDGQFKTAPIKSVDVPATICIDGPFGLVTFMNDPVVYGTNYYPSQVVLASSWNTELAFELGKTVGNESLFGDERDPNAAIPYSGWYAPGVNIHRSPFGGRLGEYYSEDPFISGRMGARVVAGARTKGVVTFVKHFAVNEQETSRVGIATWLTEQALREIYLRPFEMAVIEGKTLGIMSSFNRIGTMGTFGDYRLLTEILRNEWGFEGAVVCDYFTGAEFWNARQMIYAGGDLHLVASNLKLNWFSPSRDNPTDIMVLQQASKNILYAVSRSNIMNVNIIGYRMAGWKVVMIIIDAAVVAGLGVWGFLVICHKFNYLMFKKNMPKET